MPDELLVYLMPLLVVKRKHEAIPVREELHVELVRLIELGGVVEDITDARKCVEHLRDRLRLGPRIVVVSGQPELGEVLARDFGREEGEEAIDVVLNKERSYFSLVNISAMRNVQRDNAWAGDA